ncbi:MAG: hypothetical protein LBH62_00910 [Nitrososphaerota archaeon]|jgi:hypothetical protein|nr:hypothetical protein [Nitrososphaerota archaeon]
MQEAKNKGNNAVDLTAQFVTPLSILPLVVCANYYDLTINCTDESNRDTFNYLNTIEFPNGIKSFNKNNKRYLPIMNISTRESDEVLSDYEERMLSQFGLQTNVLKNLTCELVNNVREHSKKQDYWMLAQTYQNPRKTVEIVLADCGVGYKQSYKGTQWETKTDTEAIINALDGRSSKTELQGRGFGIPSIIKTFVDELCGKIIIISGNSLVYYKRKERIEKQLKSYWQGSVIGINCLPKDVDFYGCIGR